MYKERASAMGSIMTNPRSKSEILSQTAKTRIQEKFLEDHFNIKKNVWSKYTDKGILQENESIKLFAKVAGMFGVTKNEQSFENDYFTGTPDILTESHVIDIKTSWDGSTFPFFADPNKVPNKGYEYQLQAYMNLTGKRKALLVYCLTDADEQMIMDETRRQCWQHRVIDMDGPEADKIENKVREQLTFDRIPDELRVKIFEIEYDENTVDEMQQRVILCRDYYEELETQITIK
jgi:hypothetical protein